VDPPHKGNTNGIPRKTEVSREHFDYRENLSRPHLRRILLFTLTLIVCYSSNARHLPQICLKQGGVETQTGQLDTTWTEKKQVREITRMIEHYKARFFGMNKKFHLFYFVTLFSKPLFLFRRRD
jgi:hypothetical protein